VGGSERAGHFARELLEETVHILLLDGIATQLLHPLLALGFLAFPRQQNSALLQEP